MKKGDWVEFTSKSGVVKKGILHKGGAKFVVHYDFDHKNGTCLVAGGDPKFFRPTEAPRMDSSNIMDAYSIKGFKEAGGDETVRFEAIICKDGKAFATVCNGGCGGPNDYSPYTVNDPYPFTVNTKQQVILNDFMEDAIKWMKFHKVELSEPHDLWVDWVTTNKPNGVSADVYWESFKNLTKGNYNA